MECASPSCWTLASTSTNAVIGFVPSPRRAVVARVFFLAIVLGAAPAAVAQHELEPEAWIEMRKMFRAKEPTPTIEQDVAAEVSSDVLPNSIAVLPFENLSPDPDNAYFAAGIHESTLNQLAKIRDLSSASSR